MTLSIRARLTLWYCSVVVIVMTTGALVGSFAQRQLTMNRLDEDLARTMATLEGVMRTEFGEGLSLEAAAEEASLEVVAPDRTLVLARDDGTLLQVWGLPMERSELPVLVAGSATQTRQLASDEVRLVNRRVEHAGHSYRAAVMAPLGPLRAEQTEMTRAIVLGLIVALAVAGAGGLIIARQTLRPLTRMAAQARGINESDPRERLTAPPARDELEDLATSFNGLLDRLAAALDHQRQFMADASHELRTPVSVVRTASQVTLARGQRSAPEYREALLIIGEQATRLSKLVDAMFLLSRAEAHGIPLRPEFVNLDELLAESVRAVRVLAERRGVSVVAGGDEEVGLVGDDALLRQMLGNLLDNAVRHADTNGHVRADVVRSAECVNLHVTNDGPGIDPADHERIFGRFVRIGTSDGAGLGLPIARWIAEAHRGTLVLDSSQPGRTTFTATLPASPPPGPGLRSRHLPAAQPAGRNASTAPGR